MIFENYAKYYDLLYQDKDYEKEIDFIVSLIEQHSHKKILRILDIGCGTGIHANYLAEKGYLVTGIDFSEEMIDIANKNKHFNTEFYIGDATNFNIKIKFDIILSLFHVVSYQTSNKNISNMFNHVYKHLKKGGLFIFDFWHAPAVLIEKPTIKIKRIENDAIKITRIAEPSLDILCNTVDVKYEITVTYKENNQVDIGHL